MTSCEDESAKEKEILPWIFPYFKPTFLSWKVIFIKSFCLAFFRPCRCYLDKSFFFGPVGFLNRILKIESNVGCWSKMYKSLCFFSSFSFIFKKIVFILQVFTRNAYYKKDTQHYSMILVNSKQNLVFVNRWAIKVFLITVVFEFKWTVSVDAFLIFLFHFNIN